MSYETHDYVSPRICKKIRQHQINGYMRKSRGYVCIFEKCIEWREYEFIVSNTHDIYL